MTDKTREALERLCKSFPDESDMEAAGWTLAAIEEACSAYDAARAVMAAPLQQPQEEDKPLKMALEALTATRHRAEAAEAALSAQQPQEGWVSVPREPTPEMCRAARSVPEPVKPYPPHFHLIWAAMIAAAPSQGKEGV